MEDQILTIGGILTFITLFSVMFSVYSHFKKPQVKSDLVDAVIKERFKNHEIEQTKEFRARDEKLNDIKMEFRLSLQNMKDNDLHELKVRQDLFAGYILEFTKELAKLSTTIEERIPKK